MAAVGGGAWGAQARPARALRLVVTVLLLLGGLVGLTAPASAGAPGHVDSSATPSPRTTPGDTPGQITVRLVSMTPEVVRPGDTLTVRAEVTNTTAQTLTAPVATLSVSKYRFLTRDRLAAWADLTLTDPFGTVLESVPVPTDLEPGASATVEFSVDSDSMSLMTTLDGWGPRGMAVTVAGDGTTPASLDPAGALRTFLLWFPVEDSQITPVDVSVLVPVVGPPVDPLQPQAAAAALDATASPESRLSTVLASTQGIRDVGWAVDPALVDESPPATDETTSNATGTTISDRILDGATDREVFALPSRDADLTALAAAGYPFPEEPRLTGSISTWRTDLAWPVEDSPDVTTLTTVAAGGASSVVTAPGALPPSSPLTYTPTGRTSLSTATGSLTALVPDSRLSAQLTSSASESPVAARQRLIAELAVVSRERPAEARHLLLTVPRDWAPDPAVAQAQIAALASTPWTRLRPVSTLIGAAGTDVARTAPTESKKPEGAISSSQLDQLDSAVAEVDTFAQVVADPAALVGPVEDAARAATSVAWRTDPARRSTAVAGVVDLADAIRASVSVITAKNFNIISTGSQIPVQVVNTLDQAVTLKIALDTDDPRLVAEKSVTVTIGPGEEAREQIPVRAVGSGDVRVTAQVVTLDGTVLGSAEPFEVRVRADWENMGTAVVAGLLVVLLGGGIWRTVHRGRSDRRVSADSVGLVEPADEGQHAEGHVR